MASLFKKLRRRTKIALAVCALVLLSLAVFLLFNYLEYSKSSSIQLISFIPDSAHSAAIVSGLDEGWDEFTKSPFVHLMLPALKGKEKISDFIIALLGAAGVASKETESSVRRLADNLGEDGLVELCCSSSFAAVEFGSGDAGPLFLVGARVGFVNFLGRLALGGALTDSTGGKPTQTAIGGSTFWHVQTRDGRDGAAVSDLIVGFYGSMLFVSNAESLIRRSIIGATEQKDRRRNRLSEMLAREHAGGVMVRGAINLAGVPADWKGNAEIRDYLQSVPIREFCHLFRHEALEAAMADLRFTRDSCDIDVSVALNSVRLEERQARLLATKHPPRLEAYKLAPAGSLLCASFRFDPADSWDFIVRTVRDRTRHSVPREVGDILKALYAEGDRLILAPLEKGGKHNELLSSLGGELLVAASREIISDRGQDRVSIGLSAIASVRDGAKALALLDGLESWHVSDGRAKSQLQRESYRGIDVRMLKIAFEKYGRGFTPSYAVVSGWLVFSSSLSFVHEVIDITLDGTRMDRGLQQFASLPGRPVSDGLQFAIVDMRALRETLTEARGAIAEIQSDNVDRVAARREIERNEESALQLAGQDKLMAEWRQYREDLAMGRGRQPSPDLQRQLEKVDRLVMERVEAERRSAEQKVLDVVNAVTSAKAMTVSSKPTKEGISISMTVVSKMPSRAKEE